MTIHDFVPFWPDTRNYFVPWIRFRTHEGDTADGPMIRQGTGRREMLAWTTHARAQSAAQELTAQTGGRFEVRTMNRKALHGACRDFSFGGKLVTVVLK